MTWITGLGEKHPTNILHVEAARRWGPQGLGAPLGIVPYGPAAYYRSGDGWCAVNADAHNICYPSHSEWSIAELWFEWPGIVCNNEFTVHQTVGPSIFAYAGMCDDQVSSNWPGPTAVGRRTASRAASRPSDAVSVGLTARTLRVNAPVAVRVDLVDMSGRRLLRALPATTHAVRLDRFAPGPYVVVLTANHLKRSTVIAFGR
jgi:hypothetical protein